MSQKYSDLTPELQGLFNTLEAAIDMSAALGDKVRNQFDVLFNNFMYAGFTVEEFTSNLNRVMNDS